MNFCHILRWEILPGGDSHWLLTVQPESLVGSTNGLNPTDLKCGRVGTQAPGGKRRLWSGDRRVWKTWLKAERLWIEPATFESRIGLQRPNRVILKLCSERNKLEWTELEFPNMYFPKATARRINCQRRNKRAPQGRAVLTNGHTRHVHRAPGFFLRGPNWLWWNNFLKLIYHHHLFAQINWTKRTHDQHENKSRTRKAQKTGAYILPIKTKNKQTHSI